MAALFLEAGKRALRDRRQEAGEPASARAKIGELMARVQLAGRFAEQQGYAAE